jgi:hypothetical protein
LETYALSAFLTRLIATLKDRPALAFPLGLWVLITATAAITGPFQTFDLLAPFPRLVYWGFVVGLSIGLSVLQMHVLAARPAIWRVLGWLPFSVVFAGLLQALNLAVFPHWRGWPDYLWLLGVVVAISYLVELADKLLILVSPATDAAAGHDPVAALMERLPPEKRGRLIRMEAKDHYLSVVTAAGETLILMRMADAEALLAGTDGIRVHRSHWVMQAEAKGHLRREGRDLLLMSDGSEVPVSRGARPDVERSGLIPSRAAR